MDKQQFKEATASAKTWQDGYRIISELDHDTLVEYITALKAAQQFTDLTMRDEFLLRLAENQIRRNQDQLEGNISDPPMPLSIRIQMLINQFRDDEKDGAEPNPNEIIDEIEELVNQNEA